MSDISTSEIEARSGVEPLVAGDHLRNHINTDIVNINRGKNFSHPREVAAGCVNNRSYRIPMDNMWNLLYEVTSLAIRRAWTRATVFIKPIIEKIN